jgi:hypothetical protein
MPRKRRSKGYASKICRMRKPIWTTGKSAGPTLASTARPNGKSRPCSPKSGPPYFHCRWSHSAITNTARGRFTWTAVWKSRRPTTAPRRVGSAGVCRCNGTPIRFACSIRAPANYSGNTCGTPVAGIALKRRTARSGLRSPHSNCLLAPSAPASRLEPCARACMPIVANSRYAIFSACCHWPRSTADPP